MTTWIQTYPGIGGEYGYNFLSPAYPFCLLFAYSGSGVAHIGAVLYEMWRVRVGSD